MMERGGGVHDGEEGVHDGEGRRGYMMERGGGCT